MKYVIGAILLVAILLIIAYINRKKIYREIDELDKKKVELMHRPVTDELTKVKRLNMTGQTEEMFDRWRGLWDEVLAVDLPQVDENLFEAEEWVDKFRFGKAKAVNAATAQQLEESEQKVEAILTELSELIGSEERNREASEEIKESQRAARKKLLAHRHTFGKAAPVFEVQLDALASQFDKYEKLTKEGNYLEARETILKLQHDMNQMTYKMERLPVLLAEATSLLPSQLDEIESGYREMKKSGYLLDHLQMEKEIAELRSQLNQYKECIVKTDIHEVEEGIKDVKDSIEFFYDLLEKEVDGKRFVIENSEQTITEIEKVHDMNEQLQAETEAVQQSYHLSEDEWKLPRKIGEDILRIEKKYQLLETRIIEKNTAYSFLHDELKEIHEQLAELQKEQTSFAHFLQTLRKDEMQARQQLDELRRHLNDIFRMVKKSNMPGVPEYYQSIAEETRAKMDGVVECLNEKPLNMKAVQEKLQEAVLSVNNLEQKTDEVIEQAKLAERIIQYGNRYKRTHPNVGSQLDQAELAFRNYNYRQALEEAATAIDKVDPKALKELEDIINQQ
ncbi:septation ring formation regulator EzrA [Bacillus xiapuensis]|uniref:septation ring formation regulator EzrA n=1 Tax=Bacillus xiapuensis TaxID=2014075 RepID=UPI000C246E4C|nr:septation ring formation regulator EzrA [Bacillus xiapuensis]